MKEFSYSENDGVVFFKAEAPNSVRGHLLRLGKGGVVFEIHGSSLCLRASQRLPDLKIITKGFTVFAGEALVTSTIDSGLNLICECSLSGDGWQDPEGYFADRVGPSLSDLEQLTIQWQAHHRVSSAFKLAVADLYVSLSEIRIWLEERESLYPANGEHGLSSQGYEFLDAALNRLSPALDALIERFELACAKVEADPIVRAAHRTYLARLLHPFLLSSPFMNRIFTKPLGYAGDYEMMNMIWRNQFEGRSLFARLLNRYIVNQAPGVSVRNRVNYMTRRLKEVTATVRGRGRQARIQSIGCGPAREIQNFLPDPLADSASFELLDFNEETLGYAQSSLEGVRRKCGRRCTIKTVRRHAQYLVKETIQPEATKESRYDLIYSSGLYDYLNHRTARALNQHFYSQLSPGGLLIVSNFTDANPIRGVMEFMFEWFLIHRTPSEMNALVPSEADADNCRLCVDMTGCNAFLEVSKPVMNQ